MRPGGAAARLKIKPQVRTASTHLGGKRPERTTIQILSIEEGRKIIAEENPLPPGGEGTVLGPSSTEKDRSFLTGRTTGSCLDHVALLQRPLLLAMLAHARARRKAAFDTRCQKIPEVIENIATDRCLRQCVTTEASEPNYVKPS